jgi:hypothetical protein
MSTRQRKADDNMVVSELIELYTERILPIEEKFLFHRYTMLCYA